MHVPHVLLTLTGAFAAALLLGYITQRVKLSPIVGYLLAGIVVGPFTPGFKADREAAEQLAEIGVILLMFGVGLSFHLRELLAVRRVAVPGALGQITCATLLGALAGLLLGWGLGAGLVYGLAISVASTVVLIRVLSDNNDLHTPAGHIAVGWLVIEDLFTVAALVLLPALSTGNSSLGSTALAVGLALLKMGLAVATVFLVGGRVVPWLLTRVANTGSRELFTLTVLVVALGIAVGSAQLFGVSMALGAFMAGLIVGRSEFSLRAATEAMPMRDAFAVLFFVSVGMLFKPSFLFEQPLAVLLTLAIVLIGKPLASLFITLSLGYPMRAALAVSAALAQIGEFSFILAALGRSLEVIPAAVFDAIVAAAIISIALNPLVYRNLHLAEGLLQRIAPLVRWSSACMQRRAADMADTTADQPHNAVIVGYGPVGRTLHRLFKANGLAVAVIEMNVDTQRQLTAAGVRAVYGDAAHRDTLRAAGVEHASTFILSVGGLSSAPEIVRLARAINPELDILARASYLKESEELRQAGANTVFTSEGEVALAMAESVLRGLGATPEQIDRERARFHGELDPSPGT